ncbi:ComEA family DNA-binding protein [Knoellia locipacati]|uniref:helix-hairpin-helix domain-containing protein n=1 Tax=Knoellia locipacati TaxID=882824 RepID=UPI00384B9642
MPSPRDSDAISPRALARVREPNDVSTDPSGGATRGASRGATRDPSVGAAARAAPVGVAGAERGRHRPLEVPRGPVFELPSSLRGARWVPSRSAAAAVLAVIVVVVLVFGVRLWLAGSGGGDVVGVRSPGGADPSGVSRGTSTMSRASPAGSTTGSPDAGGGAAGAVGSAGAASGAAGILVIHVVGQVRTPGVYRMSVGARVGDAVTAAGGAKTGADLAAVNLARVLVDGEQVVVPRPGEAVAAPGAGVAGQTGGAGGAGGVAGSAGSAGGKVALNSADLSALDTLPGVGPVLAQRILDWRTEHGRFTSVEELGEVSGIGEKLLAQLTPKVTL